MYQYFMKSSPTLVGEHGIMQMDFGQTGNGSHHDVFDARLHGGGDGDTVAVTAQACSHPDDVNLFHIRGTPCLNHRGTCWTYHWPSP